MTICPRMEISFNGIVVTRIWFPISLSFVLQQYCNTSQMHIIKTSCRREHKLANTEHCYMQCWTYHVNITRETYNHDNVTREMYHENTAVSQRITQIRLYIRRVQKPLPVHLMIPGKTRPSSLYQLNYISTP
jgi:hypothetical protein